MAITTTQLAASYFVHDVPDVRWTSAATAARVRLVITPQNGNTVDFTETYVADADGAVTLRGLAELIEPYVKPCPTPLRQDLVVRHGVWLATVVRAAFTAQLYDASGTTIQPTFHSYAYYASRRTSVTPGATAVWLTRYTERTILAVQPVCLSVLLMDGMSARFVVEGVSEGTVQTATVGIDLSSAASGAANGTAPAYAAVVHYTVADIAEAAAVGQVQRVTAELMKGTTVADSVTFNIDRSHHAQQRVVAFTNCFGMLETEAFTGTDAETTELDNEYAWIDRDFEKTYTREVTEHRLAARFSDKNRRNSLRDITASSDVYLIHENGKDCWQKMTVTALEMTDSHPHTSPPTAYLTLRPSAMHQETVLRQGDTDPSQTRHRIFDYTHDYTFN